MKYTKLFEDFNRKEEIIRKVNLANMQMLSNSLINNTYIRRKTDPVGVEMKVVGIKHEDGSGKTFIVTVIMYDANKKFAEKKDLFFRL